MSSLHVVAGTICMTMFVVGRGGWTDTPVKTTLPRVIQDSSTTAVSSLIELGEAVADDDGQPLRLDKYGNQIETAIGDYRIDPRGDIYERHSPETALPDLVSPTT